MRVLERSDGKLGCHPPFKMSGDASLFCLYCLGITPPGHSDLRVLGLLPPRCSLYGRVFLAFKVSRRIPISTFGHSNACCQSRRADCGLSHACLRSSAACAFCGVLCVLDGFVMKCPKVETMCLDGAEIPGSVNFGGARSQLYGATGPFWWCVESVLAVLGIVVLCLPRSDNHIYPRGGRRSNFLAGERRANMIVGSEQKRRPEGRLACK